MSDDGQHDAWARPYFEPGGGDALFFYVLFGRFADELKLPAAAYRTRGLPAGVEMRKHARGEPGGGFESFVGGPLATLLDEEPRELADAARAADACVVVRGTVPDSQRLDDLRDTLGVVACLLDGGGVALLDPQTLRWWSAAEWRREFFEPDAPEPHRHVVIFASDAEDGSGDLWLHTRGLRKFGRADLSARAVDDAKRDAVVDLFNRFITLQALGGVIPDGQPINLRSLPRGGTCARAGSYDDPDFNNVHVEIRLAR